MKFEVHPADPEIFNERKWVVFEKFDEGDTEPRFWARFVTEQEAQDAANEAQAESDCMDYIRGELEQIAMLAGNDIFGHLGQNEMRDLIRQVADDGGF